MALRDEIGADLGSNLAGAVRVFFGKPDPLDRRMARGDLAAKQTDTTAADDRQTYTLGIPLHEFTPAMLSFVGAAACPTRSASPMCRQSLRF